MLVTPLSCFASVGGAEERQKIETVRGVVSTMVMSLDGKWMLATDSQNVGRKQKWYSGPVPEAKETKVPWVIQDAFPGYHGVAWYWRDFVAPHNPHAQGRYLLRFWAVDYMADVWLNGVHVGGHEGGETPFVLDVTDAVKPIETNLVAVRVLNTTHERIDGILLGETPHGCKNYPLTPGGVYNVGGIVDSVELLVAPAVRVENLFVRPDPKTGEIRIQANLRNATTKSMPVFAQFTIAPAYRWETLDVTVLQCELPPGDTLVETKLNVQNPRLWELNVPFLYRTTAKVWEEGAGSFDEQSTRCGFRDFRFEDGYFRLNGRRIFLCGPLDLMLYPIGFTVPHDPDFLRRNVLCMKTMGFNICRLVFGGTMARQLDVFDELGVMVYQENYGTWQMQESQKMEERFDRALAEIIRRDRNHPNVVIWGLLNETADGRLFRHAVDALPFVRSLDDSRMVMLNSGRWDNDWSIGSLSNPGSSTWESPLRDQHAYPNVPHTADIIQNLRTLGSKENPVLLSEYGTGCAVDLPRFVRHYEQLGAEYADDARFYRDKLDKFMVDWERWKLAECWARPEDFFAESNRNMAKLRLTGGNALRANPNLAGHFVCAIVDSDFDGVGLINGFRELKPDVTDAIYDTRAPLRWCLFVEPVNIYSGASVRLETVLANEDILRPGDYPVRLQVVGPNCTRIFENSIRITIPDLKSKPEPPFALPVFSEDVVIDGPSGKYRFLATFERGGAAAGGDVEFYVADPAEMPPVDTDVALWGEDQELAKWLTEHGIRVRPFSVDAPASRELILVGNKPAAPGNAELPRELVRRIARGSTAIFLSPAVFANENRLAAWLPLVKKGVVANFNAVGGYYRGDSYAKNHPIFDGLPSGGIMDYTFYREIIPQVAWSGLDTPAEAVAGAIRATLGYSSGLLVAIYNLGAGRFILNTLRIREELGRHPAAERLLRNMLRYAAVDSGKPLKALPDNFDSQLKASPLTGGAGYM